MQEQVQLVNSDYQRSLLSGLDLFRGVIPDDIQSLLQQCERRDVGAGELLLSPGTCNDSVFVVLSGGLNVHVGCPDTPPVATLRIGACAGEMSIIEERDPSAFVIAAEPSHLLVIHKNLLWSMVDASHEFAKNLLLVLSERVRAHNQFIASSIGDMRKHERNATTDALTGLGNRHAMEDEFPQLIRRCSDEGDPVSMIMIDVDRFKVFNDRFGHIAGDRALSAVAEVLVRQFRPCDRLVRYGGDEFAVLLPGVSASEAGEIANRARMAVCGDLANCDDSLIRVPLRISMGVAELDDGGCYKSLLSAADEALYRAKDAGRNTVCA